MPNGNFNCAERQLLLSQGTTLALQKDSFCSSKGLVLQSKRTRFAIQKDSFCNPKGLLLKNRWILSEKGKVKNPMDLLCTAFWVTIMYFQVL